MTTIVSSETTYLGPFVLRKKKLIGGAKYGKGRPNSGLNMAAILHPDKIGLPYFARLSNMARSKVTWDFSEILHSLSFSIFKCLLHLFHFSMTVAHLWSYSFPLEVPRVVLVRDTNQMIHKAWILIDNLKINIVNLAANFFIEREAVWYLLRDVTDGSLATQKTCASSKHHIAHEYELEWHILVIQDHRLTFHFISAYFFSLWALHDH